MPEKNLAARWFRRDPKETIAEIIVPDKKLPSMSLASAIRDFKKNADYKGKSNRDRMSTSIGVLMVTELASRPIAGLKVSELVDVMKKAPLWRTSATRQFVPHLFRHMAGLPIRIRETDINRGESLSANAPVSLDIRKADLSNLGDFLDDISSTGRFADTKLLVFQNIKSCPPNEFRVIPEPRNMTNDKKERIAFQGAIKKLLDIKKLRWEMRYSRAQHCFAIARIEDWNKLEKKEEKK